MASKHRAIYMSVYSFHPTLHLGMIHLVNLNLVCVISKHMLWFFFGGGGGGVGRRNFL